MVNILTEKYRKLMQVKNSESQRKAHTQQHLKHPINHRGVKTPQNRQRQRGLLVRSDRGGRCWQVLSCEGRGRVTWYKEDVHT